MLGCKLHIYHVQRHLLTAYFSCKSKSIELTAFNLDCSSPSPPLNMISSEHITVFTQNMEITQR